MIGRRLVRATYGFFEDVDRQLGVERGPNGEPSTADFQTIDLLRIVDRFADEFDDLPELIEPAGLLRQVRVGVGT